MNHNEQEVLRILQKMKVHAIKHRLVEVRGLKTIELLNETMMFDCHGDGIIEIPGFETSINYVQKELMWYESASNKSDFISAFASLWDNIKDGRGFVNSNYGHLIFSPQNCYQYDNCVKALKEDKESRRAIMVYCPNHIHYTGGNDYVCTMYVSYMIRHEKLCAFVSMRSNDLRYGLVGADLAWQIYVLKQMSKELDIMPGNVHWHACSLHLYEKHFGILEEI